MTLQEAVQKYVGRRDRNEHPVGKFDRVGRWYPGEGEECGCCRAVRSPSRSYPYSLMLHCRSLKHIAHMTGYSEKELRAELLKKEKPMREGGDNYYKLVAIDPDTGKMVSVFDGETEYRLGITLNGKARQDHRGGYYCYDTAEKALNAPFPAGASGKNWKHVLLRVRAQGNYCVYGDSRKLSFSKITPIEVIEK